MIDVGKVGMVPIDKVIVDDRTREDMGNLEELRANMQKNGLIGPLAFLALPNGYFKLLAGGRRFAVISSEPGVTEVPARIYERELNELEMAIIEESENLYRKEMTWIEKDKLTAKIHRLNQELYGVKGPGPTAEGWGTKETAEAIGAKSRTEITEALKRTAFFEEHPELFVDCKTASDASKVISKVSEAAVKQQIAAEIEEKGMNVTLQKLNDAYIIRDFFEGVKELPDNLFHLIEIDPPYGIKLMDIKQKDSAVSQYQTESYNEIDSEEYPKFLEDLFKECYRVAAENSWLICWFAPEPYFNMVYKSIMRSGFNCRRIPLIWTKTGPGQTNNPQLYLANTYEMAFYAWKGRPVINKAGHANTFHYSTVPPSQKCHPTERPLALMKELYETFAFPGSRLLIPFLGSGNGLLAASELGISALGFEKSREYKDSFLVKAHNLLQRK
jgi:site-specific DNA-methyltransferase (adenine-specific)